MRFGLLKKTVITASGQVLGRVKDIEAVWPDFRVVAIVVGRGLAGLRGELIVAVDAIIKIEKETIVVEDGVVSELSGEQSASVKLVSGATVGPMTRE